MADYRMSLSDDKQASRMVMDSDFVVGCRNSSELIAKLLLVIDRTNKSEMEINRLKEVLNG